MKNKIHGRYPGIVVISLVILGITLALFLLIRSGILVPHRGNGDDDGEMVGIIPDMDEPGRTEAGYYDDLELEAGELLGRLTETEKYLWVFRSIEAWENEYTVERVIITRDGEKYRIEKEDLLVICDGENIYRREGMMEAVYPASVSDLCAEAGLTSLSAVRETAADPNYTVKIEYDDPVNPRNIRVSRSRGTWRDEFVVSIETGIPVTERSYMGSMAYRMILTDSISADAEIDGKNFLIPGVQ